MRGKRLRNLFKKLIIAEKREISDFSRCYLWSLIISTSDVDTLNFIRTAEGSTNPYDIKYLSLLDDRQALIDELVIDMVKRWHTEDSIDEELQIQDAGSFFFTIARWVESRSERLLPKLEVLVDINPPLERGRLEEFVGELKCYIRSRNRKKGDVG